MTTDDGSDRRYTLHGDPVSLTSYVSARDAVGGDHYQPYPHAPRPPRKGGSGVLIAIAVVAVLLVGAGGLLAWLMTRDGDGDGRRAAEAGAREHTAVVTLTNAPQAPVTVPAQPSQSDQAPPTEARPPADEGNWYAQLGAFNEYGNAVAAVARNPGSVLLPGSQLGLSTRYVVVHRATSRAGAQAVCSQFDEGECYVRSHE